MKFHFLLILFVAFASLNAHSQERLKNKYFGIYKGKINSYQMETAGYLIGVSEAKIAIEIGPNMLSMSIGKSSFSGPYQILFEAKDYYVLEAKLLNQPIPERVLVYKKGKKVSRDGLFPQPDAILFMN
jgi:hypothetical protein